MANSAPLEVLEQMFFPLSIPTLKNVGSVCQSVHYAAEKFMFREVLLLPNAESFAKLRKISRHARLKYYVKNLVYSGKMLFRYNNYDEWYSGLGRRTSQPLADDYEYTKAMNREQFDEEELKKRYARYCFWVESEKRAQFNGNARRWMIEALSLLPNLASVTLTRRLERNWPGIKVKLPGCIAQESLCEPDTWAGIKYYPDQFGDLARAAHASGVSLECLDGSRICWHGFEDYSESLARVVQGVTHLSLEFQRVDGASKYRRDMLREVVNSASELQTLEISFIFLDNQGGPRMQLSHFLPRYTLWSSLRRLKLEAIATSQLELIATLSRHATTLRSLELGHILFDRREAEEGTCAGSWTDMIHFLRRKLSLTDVSLHGRLSNGFSEAWDVSSERSWRDVHYEKRDAQLPPLEETLKFAIERYIVEGGGVCPLDNPDVGNEFDRDDFWHAIEDYSWSIPRYN